MRYLICLLISASAFAATIDSAYYAPDRGTPYAWFEGAPGITEYFSKDYRAAGYLYVYVRHDGKEPLTATGFALDGKPLAELREAQQVVWWRLLPNPLLPGQVGEFMLRLRQPLTTAAAVTLSFADGTTLTAAIGPEPNPLRLATVGFSAAQTEVFLVAESLDGQPRQLARVLLDGADVTRRCRLLAPRFVGDCSPVLLRLDKPLELGSFHTYTVVTKSGEQASCCLKTLDGFVPLGSYGYGTYEEYVRNGCNSYANFSKSTAADLDSMARLEMRGASMLGSGVIAPYEVAHPGLYAHYIHDEPDCTDYTLEAFPHPLRIGQMAMEMERRVDYVRQHDPTRPSFLTVDMTYKPANYYIYGPIADIVNPDCYSVTIGQDATQVREVVETCRIAAGPRPLTFTFSSTLEGPRDPVTFGAMRFPRPNFPLEQRVMMYYAIGAGARGLFNYIHCTENSAARWSRGSSDWPELWNEIGLVYRELEAVSPLLALAHPTRLATSPTPKLWLRTLLCGDAAALIVWVNDNYQQNRLGVRYQPLESVQISLPELPWLKHWQAYSVGPGGFTALPVTGRDLLLPRAEIAGMILVTADAALPGALAARTASQRDATGRRLLEEWRRRQAEQARKLEINRLIAGELKDYAVEGKGVGTYGMKLDSFWNPKEEPYNVLEFGANEATDEVVRGAEYVVTVPAEQVGKPYVVYALAGSWSQPCTVTVSGPAGPALLERATTAPFEGELLVLRFTPPQAGEHRITYLQAGRGAKGGRISHVIYVLPASAVFAPLPSGE
jgi:hypothetical protein